MSRQIPFSLKMTIIGQPSCSYRKRTVIFVGMAITYLLFMVKYEESAWNIKQILNNLSRIHNFTHWKEFKMALANPQEDQTKYILLYTTFFHFYDWELPNATLGPEFFEDLHCPETRCVLNTDRSIRNVSSFDALVFHGAMNWTEPPPKIRNPNQLYVFAILESPEWNYFPLDLQKLDNFFNLTMTYRLDSDVRFLYGNITDKLSGEVIEPGASVEWREVDQAYGGAEWLDVVQNKTKDVAWFVSDCQTVSKRNELVDELKKFISVDVYGECGTLKCEDRVECARMLERDYRFYLALENSLCTDYVTEKLYQNLRLNLIPIVYGGANYSMFAPPKSFINANDFATVEELANYLKFLKNNPKEYVKYFWWKQFYTSGIFADQYKYGFCELCRKMHEPGIQDGERVYESIYEWWKTGMCTRTPKIRISEKQKS